MKSIKLFCLVAAICSLGLTACSTKDVTPGHYDASEVGKVKKVTPGTVISMRPVLVRNKAAESNAGNPNPATEAADSGITSNHGFEYVVRLNSGAIISLVQTDAVKLAVKQHVLVIYGDNTRVVPDDGGDEY